MSTSAVKEIAFIDRAITDLDSFLAGLRPDVEPIILAPCESATAQIAQALCGHSALAAIHIVAHGEPGQVSFESGPLSLETIKNHADELEAIGRALGSDGNLLLWTCRTAQGERGHAFVEALSRASGAAVAATTKPVGAHDKGGCWELDTQAGRQETLVPLTPGGQANYAGVMATFNGTNGNDTADATTGAIIGFTGGTVAELQDAIGDTFNASGGNDTITGGSGNDTINAGSGADTIRNFVGADSVDGGADTDTLMLSTTSTDLNEADDSRLVNVENVTLTAAGITLNLGTQTEGFTITGSSGADSIIAGDGADDITGGGGADTINAGDGNDTIRNFFGSLPLLGEFESLDGGDGDEDTLVLGGASLNDLNLALDGHLKNVEIIDAKNTSGILDLHRQSEGFIINSNGPSNLAIDVTGGVGADTITTGANSDIIRNFVGADSVDGGENFDHTDTDRLLLDTTSTDLNEADDSRLVNVENVTLTAAGITLNLGTQTEGFTITGSSGADSIIAGDGADDITGGGGADTINAGDGNDTIRNFFGSLPLLGEFESLDGGDGDEDTLVLGGASLNDLNLALDGHLKNVEIIDAKNTSGILDLHRQSEGFTINSDSPANFAINLTGSSGADRITTGANGDIINGFVGADSIDGGENFDHTDTDTLRLSTTSTDLNSAADDKLLNVERVELTAGGVTVNLERQTEGFTIAGSAGNDTITATNQADTIFTGNFGNDTIDARGGNDTITNFLGVNTVDGGDGDEDTLVVTTSSPLLASADDDKLTGVEIIDATGGGAFTLSLAKQTEGFTIKGPTNHGIDLTGSADADRITTGAHGDIINGFVGADSIDGGENFDHTDTDTLRLSTTSTDLNSAADDKLLNVERVELTAGGVTVNLERQTEGFTIVGSAGNDTITATNQADTIFTGNFGNDTIDARGGNDTITNFLGVNTVDGGDGDEDTLVVTTSSPLLASADDDKLTGVEIINATGGGTLTTLSLAKQTEGFTINSLTGNAITLTGSAGADRITTGGNADIITGGGGNDTIDGGLGTDRVILSGNRSDYSITLTGPTYTFIDTRSGPSSDGTDTVTNVENFQFSNGTFTTATLDATPPTVSSVTYGSHDGTLKAGEAVTLVVTFSETVTVAGGTPTLSLNSGGTASFTSGSGTTALTFSYTVASGHNTADLAVTAFNLNGATVQDAQGNHADTAGAVTNPTGVLVVDTVPPAAGTTLDLAEFIDSGTSASDFVSTDNSFDLSLEEHGGSTEAYEVSTNGGGTWTPTTAAQTALADGSYQFRAQIFDVAGNSTPSNVVSVTVDTTAPTAPTVDGLITPDTTPTITGTATLAAGEQLTVTVNGATYTNVPVTSGPWSIDTDTATPSSGTLGTFLPGTTYDVTATVTDLAGNESGDTNELIITDTTPPTVSSVAYGSHDGTLKAGEAVTLVVTFSETVTVAGGTPTLSLNSGGTASFTSGSGTTALTFSYTVASGHNTADLAVTAFNLNGATVQDAQGNHADTAGAVTNPAGVLAVDTVAPTAGTLALAAFTDSGASSSDFVSTDNTFDLSLTGNESGATVAYERSTDGGSTWGPTTTTQSALADDSYQFRVQVSDLASNTSTSNVVSVTVDTTAPMAPRVDAQSTSDTTPVLSGTATLGAGEQLSVTVNGATYSNVPVTSGVWSIDTNTATPSSGTLGAFIPGTTYSVTATVTDLAGNATPDPSVNELVITDATPPTVSSVAYGSHDGTLKAGEMVTLVVTFSETVTVAGGTPTLSLNSGGTASLTSGSGTTALIFTYTVASGHNTPDLAVAAFNLNGATVKDAQGNDADTTGAMTNPTGALVVDTIAPAAGTLALAAFTDSGTSSSDFVSTDSTFDLNLTGNDSGATVAYERSTNGGDTWTPTTAAQNSLADGSYQFRAQVSDLAGNTSTSTVVSVTVDTTAPAAPTVNALSTSDTTPVLSGFSGATLGAGEQLAVTVNGATYSNVPVTSGAWSLNTDTATPSSGTLGAFVPGTTYSVTATVTDLAGNATADTTTNELVITSTVPTTTATITNLTETTANSASSTSLTLSGTLSAALGSGEVVRVSDGATVLGNAVVSGTTWSFATGSTTAGNHTFTVAVANATNQSAPSSVSVLAGTTGNNNGGTALTGTSAGEYMFGFAGTDTINGFAGSDTVMGGAGSDTILLTTTSADLNNATDAQIRNVETVSAAGAATTVIIDLHNQSESLVINGSGNDDTITAGSGVDAISGSGGADSLTGGAGNDFLTGGAGIDNLNGGAGGDTLIGGDGSDTIDVGVVNDNVQDRVQFFNASEFGDTVSNFDSTGLSGQVDLIDFGGSLRITFDDIGANRNFAWVTGNGSNGGNTTANLNTTGEALYLAGTNDEGVVDTSLLAATTVAAEFNAEFSITANNGQDALLVVNATNSTRFAVYSYRESGSVADEIQSTELTLIGVFNSNGDVGTSQFGLI